MNSPSLLVLNTGSSSIKFSIYASEPELDLIYEGEVSGIGTPEAKLELRRQARTPDRTPHGGQAGAQDAGRIGLDELKSKTNASSEGLKTFHLAVKTISSLLKDLNVTKPAAVGHRVVHSGPSLKAHQKITPQVFELIRQSIPFAPLHQPLAIEMIEAAREHFPGVDNYACFDTIFHQSMPEVAFTYPLEKEIRERGIRKYGFHGLSCESVVDKFEDARMNSEFGRGGMPSRLIIAHLGNGASLTAVVDGHSVDTTMGLTPCGGAIMGSRSGDLDPGLIFSLLRMQTGTIPVRIDAVEQMLNVQSGMKAVSGLSNDMRELRQAAEAGDTHAKLAIEMFIRNIKKVCGAFAALMGGLDAIVFTGGIGEHDCKTRSAICSGLGLLTVELDDIKNNGPSATSRLISPSGSSHAAIYVFRSEENRIIARHVLRLMS